MHCGLLLLGHVWLAAPPAPGALEGTVVNASAARRPAAAVEVVLRIRQDGRFIPLAETTSDEAGRFTFRDLPLDNLYLPGANWEQVHYPGQRCVLDAEKPHANVELAVYDTIAAPSPLAAREHQIVLRPEAGRLEVTETILISNASLHTYVGRITTGHMPVTLRLSIPSNFKKVTFHKEFFGRRFHLIKGALLTAIPWTPGQTELKFTYIVPAEEKELIWERPLDMPCAKVNIRVLGKSPEHVDCSLPSVRGNDEAQALFASQTELRAGQVVRVELKRLAGSFMAWAKWTALGLLVGLIVAGLLIAKRRHPAGGAPHAQRRIEAGSARRPCKFRRSPTARAAADRT